ncbi:Ubiquitin carboxyl-terminal hydrolase 10 [Bulinus truncatus]|nr:Ubiquitin carboxyl-terminal hydrolase 10 [Bulinus truncatus]
MANEYEGSFKTTGLSFINWDDLTEEEYHKLDKILNASSVCTGVQFPFPSDGDKVTDKFQHGPVFQPAIPPPPILGYPIPVHHWTPGDPSAVHPSGPPYSIALPGTYMFSNSPLTATGDGTMTFVPALNTGQPIYTIPAPHLIPTHYTTAPQSEPVDLTAPVTRTMGDVAVQQQSHPHSSALSEPCTHQIMLTHMSHMNVGIADNTNFMPPLCLPHAGVHHTEGASQVVYIAQQNVLTTASCNVHENPQTHSEHNINTGLQSVQESSSIEFGGPVIFSSHLLDTYQPEQNNNKPLTNHDTVLDEVVIDMEGLHLSQRSSAGENVENEGPITIDQSSQCSAESATCNSSHLEQFEFTKPSLHTDVNDQPQSPSNASSSQTCAANKKSELEVKQSPVPPTKMWSSLFGSEKSNTSINGGDITKISTVVAVPNAILKDEVKSVRYWQEKEKAEAKQSIVLAEKVITVGPHNDPFAVKILEQLNNLQIIHAPIVIQPRGLVNGSNICFMNATLQVLMGCPPFIHLFRAFKDLPPRPGSYSSTPIFDSLVQFVNSFQNGQRIRNSGSRNKKGTIGDINLGQPFSPTPLLQVAQNILGLHIGVQHDAEEFLSQILMICHEELENIMKLNHADGLNNNDKRQIKNGHAENDLTDTDDNNDDESWQKVGPKNHHVETNVNDCGETPLSNIFAGLSRSCLIRESGKTSDTLDTFFTLKLDIQAENIHSVKDALLRLNSTETVHDADGGKIQGQRRMFFDVLPPVLIMHLKLFQYSNGNGQKIQKKIDFDVDLVIPKETLSRNGKVKFITQKSRTYKLFGVVNHHGIKMNDGHYTSDVYLPAASGWLRFDDSEVVNINEAQVLQHSERRMPYLLFYRRMDLNTS